MSTAVSALPRCVALRSKHDNNYLRSVHDDNHGGRIELGGDGGGVMDPRCRFYLEPSEEHEGLVHVRCCYNNKYWVPQQRVLHGGTARWEIDTAHEPEEDLSKPSCTLHKLSPIAGEQAEEDGSTCRILHSKLAGKYACVASTPFTSTRSYMHIASHEEAGRQDSGLIDAFTLIDVSDQKQLPLHLVFKGDNGRFLGLKPMMSNYGILGRVGVPQVDQYLQFSGNDIGDERVMHTIFTNHDGIVRIKSNSNGLFWRNGRSWVFADSDDTTYTNPDTLFRVTTGDDDIIALRNLGTNDFCKRLTTDPRKTDCLAAAAKSITNEARIKCHEPVLSRHMEDVHFRLSEAKKYTTAIEGLHSQTVINHKSTTDEGKITYKYKNTVESTWSSTTSWKISTKITLVTKVPFWVNGEFDDNTEFGGSYTWGKADTREHEVTEELKFDVPPKTKVTVKAIGSNGVCHIPFSYKQRDVLTNGLEVYKDFTDGMYVGVKTSDVTFESIPEPLK